MSIKMSQKELDVLAIIFHSESPMTISDVVKTTPQEYTLNIVKPIVRKLIQLQMIEDCGFTYRGTSIARKFVPTKQAHIVLEGIFQQEYQNYRKVFQDNSLLLALVKSEFSHENNQEDIKRLEDMLDTIKAQHSTGGVNDESVV